MEIYSSHTQLVKRTVTKKHNGFTLIELLVVVLLISVLVTISLLFNPLGQLEKARNSTREQDLNQIKSALDAYFNDTGCYPTSIPFSFKWSVGSTIYMSKIPEDPACSLINTTYCYNYQTDNSSCPQWNILYTTLHAPVADNTPSCVVTTTQGCLPTTGIYTYNYCTVSGKLDCNYLSQHPLPTPIPPAAMVSPTPTPFPTVSCSGTLSACSNGQCNLESPNQCLGCGGSMQCYSGSNCGGVACQ